jgi:hypothetical protein
MCGLAKVVWKAGRLEEAEATLREASRLVGPLNWPQHEASVCRLLAKFLRETRPSDVAAQDEAIALEARASKLA